tara:strand:+ start:335 stop:544 length:210 start_codon:yes stop_codon:yes gene_type:complete
MIKDSCCLLLDERSTALGPVMLNYFSNNHDVNVGNKKLTRDDPGMKFVPLKYLMSQFLLLPFIIYCYKH